MHPLTVESMCCEYCGFELECTWYPARTMRPHELDAFISEIDDINTSRGRRLTYGFFAQDAGSEWRRAFLLQTFWCVIRRGGIACGFAYNVDMGDLNGQRVVHAGLIRFGRPLGPEMIIAAYLPLWLGNILNFGPHVATSITHIPLIADVFGQFAHGVFPRYSYSPHPDGDYRAVLHRVIEGYILPVLRYPREAVCEHTYRVLNALTTSHDGFETRWSRVGRSPDPACKTFFEQSLSFRQDETGELHVCDDLIQIGRISNCFPSGRRVLDQLRRLKLPCIRGYFGDAGSARLPSSLTGDQRTVLAELLVPNK